MQPINLLETSGITENADCSLGSSNITVYSVNVVTLPSGESNDIVWSLSFFLETYDITEEADFAKGQ